jgi:hypothetical protein
VAGCCSYTGSGCTGLFCAGPWRPAWPARGKRGDGAGSGRRHTRPWPRATPRPPSAASATGSGSLAGACGGRRPPSPQDFGGPRSPGRGGCRVSPGYGPRVAGERVSGGHAHHREGPLASGGGGRRVVRRAPVRLERWPSDSPLNGMARFWRVWCRRAGPHRLGARRGGMTDAPAYQPQVWPDYTSDGALVQ